MPFLGQEDALEKEMATNSSILAWEIPWSRNMVGCSPGGTSSKNPPANAGDVRLRFDP